MNITKPFKVLGVGLLCMTATFTSVSAQQEDSSINKTMRGRVDITTDSETNVPISRDIPSSFSVRIPQSINFTSGNDVAGFTIEVKGNIRADEELKVTTRSNLFEIRAMNDREYSNVAIVALEGKIFNRDTIKSDSYTPMNGSVTFNETKADMYGGGVSFIIALTKETHLVKIIDVGEVPETVYASLYSNGDLIVNGNGELKGYETIRKNFLNESSYGEVTSATKKIIINDGINFPKNSKALFSGFRNVNIIEGLDKINTSNVTNMNYMFSTTQLLSLASLANWDVSNVTDVGYMFDSVELHISGVTDLTPISNWDVSNVTNMEYMFNMTRITDLTPISNWDVSGVTNMEGIFYFTKITDLTPISNWSISSVTNMNYMFRSVGTTDLTPISNWDVSRVTKMVGMFEHSMISDLTPISNWDVSNVTNMEYMFYNSKLEDLTPIFNWNISSTTRIQGMFADIPSTVARPSWCTADRNCK